VSQRTAEERFWSKVQVTGFCWLWSRAVNAYGYGVFQLIPAYRGKGGKQVKAHRHAYELLVGPIQDGMQLDHLCRVRHCVNPDHLEPVNNRTNALRGRGFAAINAAKDKCPNGHSYTEDNTYRAPRTGWRQCRACIKSRAGRAAEKSFRRA
jgi:hypothetical protein